MCRTKQVKHDLYRVECLKRDLNEECIPIAHGTIPKTWKFKSLELTTLVALGADESSILINILEKVETFPIIVMETAHNVNRIEMSC